MISHHVTSPRRKQNSPAPNSRWNAWRLVHSKDSASASHAHIGPFPPETSASGLSEHYWYKSKYMYYKHVYCIQINVNACVKRIPWMLFFKRMTRGGCSRMTPSLSFLFPKTLDRHWTSHAAGRCLLPWLQLDRDWYPSQRGLHRLLDRCVLGGQVVKPLTWYDCLLQDFRMPNWSGFTLDYDLVFLICKWYRHQ